MLSPLRNRASRHLREPFGKAGLTVAVIALVFAMLGGAYAASSNEGGKATASAKAKKGPRGPKGPAGPAGPAGPQGAAGAKGDTGAAGSNGKDGTNGKDGKSVVTGNATVGECPAGGATVEVQGEAATKKKICNGKEGTFGSGTLPKGQTLTGYWATEGFSELAKTVAVFSFPIPLATAPTLAVAPAGFAPQWIEVPPGGPANFKAGAPEEEFDEFCEGSAAEPTATAGFLCVYSAEETNSELDAFGVLGNPAPFLPTKYGAHLRYLVQAGHTSGSSTGTWAVKAP